MKRNLPLLQHHSLNHRRQSPLQLEALIQNPFGCLNHFYHWFWNHHLNILTKYNGCTFPLQDQHFHQYAAQSVAQPYTWKWNILCMVNTKNSEVLNKVQHSLYTKEANHTVKLIEKPSTSIIIFYKPAKIILL